MEAALHRGGENIQVPLGELGRDDLNLGGKITLSEFMGSIFEEIFLRLRSGDTGNARVSYKSSDNALLSDMGGHPFHGSCYFHDHVFVLILFNSITPSKR